jgi:hypothetical protein
MTYRFDELVNRYNPMLSVKPSVLMIIRTRSHQIGTVLLTLDLYIPASTQLHAGGAHPADISGHVKTFRAIPHSVHNSKIEKIYKLCFIISIS